MSDNFLIVVPAIDPTAARKCLATMNPWTLERTLLVDNTKKGARDVYGRSAHLIVNTPHNAGVARSWNQGITTARNWNAEWLVILSTSIRFGPTGGEDIADMVDRAGLDDYCVGGLGTQDGEKRADIGWHLHAFRMTLFDVVGTFDENFFPAYFEDTDMLYRMGLAGVPSPRENGRTWPYHTIDCRLTEEAAAIKSGHASIEFGRLEAYYVRKWGGKQGEERFTTPFGITGDRGAWTEDEIEIDWKWWP